MKHAAFELVFALVATAACGGGGDDGDMPSDAAPAVDTSADAAVNDAADVSADAGDVAVENGHVLELQTGAPEGFEEFADGDELLLQRGCQGSQHVFVSARGWGFEGDRLTLELSLERIGDGQVVSLPLTLRLAFAETAPEGARQVTGLTLVVPNPTDVIGERVLLHGTLSDPSGNVATRTREALIRWGPDSCGGHG